MSEIVCRNCGAQNPAQSKFCNKCGETLTSQTSQLCPNCEAQNPLDLLYCDNCGTRLADDDLGNTTEEQDDDANTGAQPFSLPSRPPGSTGNLDMSGEIPSWLKTGEMDNAAEDEEELADWLAAANPEPSDEEDQSLSLAELGGEHEPSDDLPTWLLEDNIADEIFYSEKSTDELFSGTAPAAQEDAQENDHEESDDPGEETPDWLQGLSAPDTGSLPPAQETGEAESEWSVAGESEEDDSLTSAELESWLKAMEEDGQLPDESVEPIPDWLVDEQEGVANESTFEESQLQEDASETNLPAWLAESELPEEDESEGAEQIEDESVAPDLSDWLLEAEDEEEPALFSNPPQQAGPPEEDDEIPEEDFIAWLATLDEGGLEEEDSVESADDAADAGELDFDFDPDTGVEGPMEAADEEDREETPAWLDELTEVMDEQVEAEATPPDELPEWLQTLSPEVAEQAASTVDEPEVEEPPFADFDEDASADEDEEEDDELELPNWLAGVATELEVEADDALIDELSEPSESIFSDERAQAEEVADDSFDFLTAADDEDQAGELVASNDLPDWFSDVLADIEGEEAFDLDTTLEDGRTSEELSNVPPQLAADDLPAWLDSPFTDLPQAEPTPLDEIPEWLLPMAPSEAGMAEESEEVLHLGEAEVDSSEWSDLLDVLPPPERNRETLTEAEIPEWLQALKPRSLREAGELEDEEVPLPEESEGPLAGLRGVLAISPVVSRPRAAERSDPELTIREQQQQVTLLRQLAREESQETISRGAAVSAPSYSAVARIALALLLLAAVIAGLLFPEIVPNLETATSGTLAASQSLLDEAAGEPVIVAFEYTPALNGILKPQASAVLEALAANNSQAILLSQSAAGATLAEQAAAGVAGLQSAAIGYVPGDSLGLRNLSSCMQPDAACRTIIGRRLEEATVESLQNAALLIVLTGDQENFLDWIEQVHSVSDLPMMAVVTPAIAPLAAPYQETGQLSALVSNLSTSGAAAPPGQTEALALGHWLAAVLLLLGALFTLIRSVQQGRQ